MDSDKYLEWQSIQRPPLFESIGYSLKDKIKAKSDKTEHGMEKRGKAKVKSKPKSQTVKVRVNSAKTPLVGFSGEVSYPIGTINLNVTMGEPKRLRTIPMEFVVIKSHSSYNVILGRTGLRSLGAVASTIQSMIKFPTANGIATVTTKKDTLHECQRMEEAQGSVLERRIAFP
ncbi:hypothetical protein Tco_0899965 [Tanacetum coccineum]